MSVTIENIQEGIKDSVAGIQPESDEAYELKIKLSSYISDNSTLFTSHSEPEVAHAALIQIHDNLQELTPSMSNVSTLCADDPWIDQDPCDLSEEELSIAVAHRRSLTYESIAMTLFAIEILGVSTEIFLNKDEIPRVTPEKNE